jgi:SAM-dependent methyltransferase
MHQSAMNRMSDCIDKHLVTTRHYDVLDFGSFINKGQDAHHRSLLADHDITYTGVDIQAGRNVDHVMVKPFTIPLPSNSQDLVITGQVFEHVPFPWASILEIARVLRPQGLLFLTAPSRGHHHSTYDLWRYYPDSMRAFAAYAELELLEVGTDWPPSLGDTQRHDVHAIDTAASYWGDTHAVMRKPRRRPSPTRTLNRLVTTYWANKLGHLETVPRPQGTRLRGKRQVVEPE